MSAEGVCSEKELAERMVRTVRNGGTNDEIRQEFMCSIALLKAQHWISVRDRLPETNVEVLTTYLYDDEPGERYVEPTIYFDDGDGKGHWHLGDEHTFGRVRKTIIAWMPMPEPYKPPEEVNGDG